MTLFLSLIKKKEVNKVSLSFSVHFQGLFVIKGAFVWDYSGMYSGYSAPGSRIAGMEIQVFRNRKSSQTNANMHYSNYSYSGLIPNEHTLNDYQAKLILYVYEPLAVDSVDYFKVESRK